MRTIQSYVQNVATWFVILFEYTAHSIIGY